MWLECYPILCNSGPIEWNSFLLEFNQTFTRTKNATLSIADLQAQIQATFQSQLQELSGINIESSLADNINPFKQSVLEVILLF